MSASQRSSPGRARDFVLCALGGAAATVLIASLSIAIGLPSYSRGILRGAPPWVAACAAGVLVACGVVYSLCHPPCSAGEHRGIKDGGGS